VHTEGLVATLGTCRFLDLHEPCADPAITGGSRKKPYHMRTISCHYAVRSHPCQVSCHAVVCRGMNNEPCLGVVERASLCAAAKQLKMRKHDQLIGRHVGERVLLCARPPVEAASRERLGRRASEVRASDAVALALPPLIYFSGIPSGFRRPPLASSARREPADPRMLRRSIRGPRAHQRTRSDAREQRKKP
jgi:hypothetical protein